MNSDPEKMLEHLTARGPSAELRSRILQQVGQELTGRRGTRWQNWAGPVVAAGIALAFGANIWISERHQQRLASYFRPTSLPENIRASAALVESVTDRETARAFEQRWLASSKPTLSFAAHCRALEKYFRDLNVEWKEDRREKIQKDPQDRSACSGLAPGLLADRQCHLHFDNGLQA